MLLAIRQRSLQRMSHYTGTNNGISVNIPINLIYITLQEIEVCGNFFKWFEHENEALDTLNDN